MESTSNDGHVNDSEDDSGQGATAAVGGDRGRQRRQEATGGDRGRQRWQEAPPDTNKLGDMRWELTS